MLLVANALKSYTQLVLWNATLRTETDISNKDNRFKNFNWREAHHIKMRG